MKVTRLFRETVLLRDGRKVVLRPIRTEDAPLLIELHSRLSSESQYLRFFGAKPRLTPQEAEYLAGVDFDRRFAIVAVAREEQADHIVAVGRFDLRAPDTAEAAIVVRDDYQRQGLGTAILERMAEVARGRGVRTFAGEVLAENERMINLLRANGLEIGPLDGAVVQVGAAIDELPLLLRILKLVAPYTGPIVDRVSALRRRPAADGLDEDA